MLNTLENCKGYRNWGPAVFSKTVTFRDGPRLLMDCKGSHSCINLKCKDIPEFGVDRTDFVKIEKEIYCSICDHKAIYLACDARLILEKT